jgi:ABC-type transport system involved in multi-copper enzyme maturation permease subunit
MSEDAPPPEPITAVQRIGSLLRAEAVRLRGRSGPVLALAVPVLVTGLAALGYKVLGRSEDATALFNAWGCAAQAAGAGLSASAFVLLLLCSQAIAQEASSGVLRSVLCTAARRREVFVSKALWALFGTLVLFAATWIVALLSGALLFGFGDVVETLRFGRESTLHVHHTSGAMAGILLRVVPLSLPPLAAAAFLGFTASSVTWKPSSALVSALAVYLPLEVFLKPFSDRLSPYLFVSYIDRFPAVLNEFSRGFNTARLASEDVCFALLSSALASILFLTLSFIVFVRRDVTE